MRPTGDDWAVKTVAVVADPDPRGRADAVRLVARLGCDVVEATTGDEALAEAARVTPAFVVLDVALANRSAYECCRALRERHGEGLPIIFISQHRVEPSDQVAGLMLGADEYLAKPLHPDVFTARARRLMVRCRWRASAHSLTPREQEVLSLLVAGVPAAEIAKRLCITEKTAATHIEHILMKLGAHSRAQAVAFAVRDGLVETTA